MRLVVAAVGRVKDGPERVLVERYRDRLGAAGRVLGWDVTEVAEIAEGRASDSAQRQQDEAERLLTKVKLCDFRIVLDQRGRQLDSAAFAGTLRKKQEAGTRALGFLIGGPDGHGPAVLEGADLLLSLGPMTLPHLLARVVLVEQLYRAATILTGHPYHRA